MRTDFSGTSITVDEGNPRFPHAGAQVGTTAWRMRAASEGPGVRVALPRISSAVVGPDNHRRSASHAFFSSATRSESIDGPGYRGGARPRCGPAGPSGLDRRRGDREADLQAEAAQ